MMKPAVFLLSICIFQMSYAADSDLLVLDNGFYSDYEVSSSFSRDCETNKPSPLNWPDDLPFKLGVGGPIDFHHDDPNAIVSYPQLEAQLNLFSKLRDQQASGHSNEHARNYFFECPLKRCCERHPSQEALIQHVEHQHTGVNRTNDKFTCQVKGCIHAYRHKRDLKAHVIKRHFNYPYLPDTVSKTRTPQKGGKKLLYGDPSSKPSRKKTLGSM